MPSQFALRIWRSMNTIILLFGVISQWMEGSIAINTGIKLAIFGVVFWGGTQPMYVVPFALSFIGVWSILIYIVVNTIDVFATTMRGSVLQRMLPAFALLGVITVLIWASIGDIHLPYWITIIGLLSSILLENLYKVKRISLEP